MKSRRVPDIPNEVGLDPVTGQILKGKQLYTTPPQVDANGNVAFGGMGLTAPIGTSQVPTQFNPATGLWEAKPFAPKP